MFGRKKITVACVKCNKLNHIPINKHLVISKDKTSIEFDCSCKQHNVIHMQVVRKRVNKPIRVNDAVTNVPNDRTEISPFET